MEVVAGAFKKEAGVLADSENSGGVIGWIRGGLELKTQSASKSGRS
jgi:hypothetical protein